MEKVVVSLLRGKRWSLLGLSIRNEEGDEQLRELVATVQRGLKNRFPTIQIVKRNAVRELLGE